METSQRLLRWASGIMIGLGAGHLALGTVIARDDVAGWVDRGVWAAVPLRGVVDANALGFWAVPGSFSVPLILLGALTWHLAGRGLVLPAGIGWGLAGWCVVGGVLLEPSPFFVGAVAGGLVVLAARRHDRDLVRALPHGPDRATRTGRA